MGFAIPEANRISQYPTNATKASPIGSLNGRLGKSLFCFISARRERLFYFIIRHAVAIKLPIPYPFRPNLTKLFPSIIAPVINSI